MKRKKRQINLDTLITREEAIQIVRAFFVKFQGYYDDSVVNGIVEETIAEHCAEVVKNANKTGE